jgi:hypothetical protein
MSKALSRLDAEMRASADHTRPRLSNCIGACAENVRGAASRRKNHGLYAEKNAEGQKGRSAVAQKRRSAEVDGEDGAVVPLLRSYRFAASSRASARVAALRVVAEAPKVNAARR